MTTETNTAALKPWNLAAAVSAFDAAMDHPAADQRLDPYRKRLLLIFFAGNTGGFALLGIAWMEGWLGQLISNDATYLLRLITVTFLIGLGWSGLVVAGLNRELDWARSALPPAHSVSGRYLSRLWEGRGQTRSSLETVLKVRLNERISPVRHIASMLVIFGLIGTVAGFIMALSGVDPDKVRDADAIAPMITTLIDGLGVALYTTLLGSILNVWLMLDVRLLESTAARLFTILIERGTDDV